MSKLKFLTGYAGGDTAGIDAGTKIIFNQTVSPTGWTKQVVHNDKILRVVSGTAANGGSQAFSTVFGAGKTTQSHTLSTPQMPSHSHSYQRAARSPSRGGTQQPNQKRPFNGFNGSFSTGNAGGSGGHTHNLNLDINYVDVIISQKD